MARTIRIKLFKFEELSKTAQDTAIQEYSDINLDYEWWESTYEDAANIGLKISDFDLDHGTIKGRILLSGCEIANKIIIEHGNECETYKTAVSFLDDWKKLVKKYSNGIDTNKVDNDDEFDEKADELETSFAQSILEDYRIILRNEYEYLGGEEAIKETIISNEYEFTVEGKKFYTK